MILLELEMALATAIKKKFEPVCFVVGPGFLYLIPRDCSSIVMCHIGNGNVTTREVSIFIMHSAIQNISTYIFLQCHIKDRT